jgi:hypothetical protein
VSGRAAVRAFGKIGYLDDHQSLVPAAVPSRDAVLSLVSRREGARKAFDAGE